MENYNDLRDFMHKTEKVRFTFDRFTEVLYRWTVYEGDDGESDDEHYFEVNVSDETYLNVRKGEVEIFYSSKLFRDSFHQESLVIENIERINGGFEVTLESNHNMIFLEITSP